MADFSKEPYEGEVKDASLNVQYMGYYTFRFYSEALMTFSAEFFVRNDLGATMHLLSQPGTSGCSPGVSGHNDWRCASGGLLEAQPRFEVFDQFGNRALYGEQQFMVSIFSNPGGAFLICDQRYRDLATNRAVYTSCLHNSRNGIVEFTDLRIDSISKGYMLQVEGTGRSREDASQPWSEAAESKMVTAVRTSLFDVVAIRGIEWQQKPSATPAGCSVYPPPILRVIGYDDKDGEEEIPIDFAGGFASVFIFGCTDESEDVVLQTGRDYAFASGTYVRRKQGNGDPLDINDRPSYALDAGPDLRDQFAYFCPSSQFSGTVDDGCGPYGFWRISAHAGFCGNVSTNETALQTCESGLGANTYSGMPAEISLRAAWQIRTEASVGSDGEVHYKWTDSEPDSIWFSRSAVPCATDASVVQGQTRIAAKNGMITFDDIQLPIRREFTMRFTFEMEGSDASFTAESDLMVTQGQIGSIYIKEQPAGGLIDRFVTPVLIQPLDLYGNAIRGWRCDDDPQGQRPQPQWQCTSQDEKLVMIANLHTCPLCSSIVPVKDASVAEYSTGLKFNFRPGQSGGQFVLRVEISLTDKFEGCPGKDDDRFLPAPVVVQTEPFDVDNSPPAKIEFASDNLPPSEIQSGENMDFIAVLYDENGQITISDKYTMKARIKRTSAGKAGHVYQYCGEPVRGNENTICYGEDQVSVVNSRGGAHFAEITVKNPGSYSLIISLYDANSILILESAGRPLSVVPAAPDEFISLAMQPWTDPPAQAVAGVSIDPQVDFGLFDSFGNFMDNYDYFYPIVDISIRSSTGPVLYCVSEPCDDDSSWQPYEAQRLMFRATPPQGPSCADPPSDPEISYTGPEVCGTYTLPPFRIQQIWDKVEGVQTECANSLVLIMDANLILQKEGTGQPSAGPPTEPYPDFPATITGIRVPISGPSEAILVTPAEATALALYFVPLQERARQEFSDQPRVQLQDKYGNPVCSRDEETKLIRVRVCYGRNSQSVENGFKEQKSSVGFPAELTCSPTEITAELEADGAYFLFSGLYTNRTGYNKLFFLAGSFANISMEMDVASGVASEILIIQQPQASVAEEPLITADAPAQCPACAPNVTVGIKVLDVAGNELTDPTRVTVRVDCYGASEVLLRGTTEVASTYTGYAAFTDLIITSSEIDSFTCYLEFRTANGPPYRSQDFSVAVVTHAAVLVLPTTTVVMNQVEGVFRADGSIRSIAVEARDSQNRTVISSRRNVLVSQAGSEDSLECCCYLGNCKAKSLEAGVTDFPFIVPSKVSPEYRLTFTVATPYSTLHVDSPPFAVVHDAPADIVISKSPSEAVAAGSVFAVYVQVSSSA